MPGYVPIHAVLGAGPVNELFTPSTEQKFPLGMTIDAVDPYFGYGKFVYLKAGAIENPGRLVTITNETFVTLDLATTANSNYPIYVCRQVMAANDFGWYQRSGVCPVQTANSITAGDPAGVAAAAAGKAGTLSNGRQIMNSRVLRASTFSLTKVGTTQKGDTRISVSNVDGLFVGLTPSGTGIAAGTIASIDPSGRFFTDTQAATASATVTVTFTYTDFLLMLMENSHVQGQTV